MIVTIHQPEHLPWLGFFNKMSKADIYVLLDDVQFKKNNFQNRNRILGTNGAQWIGVPVVSQGRLDSTIKDTIISDMNPKWNTKYLNTIYMFYHKYPFFEDVYPIVERSIMLQTDKLVDINLSLIYGFAENLGIAPKFIRSSEMKAEGKSTSLLLNICKELDADIYLAGPDGRNYMELDLFQEAGIEVRYNDYTHPVYPQKRAEEFVPYLSALDLFMNCGFSDALEIINKGNEEMNL